MITYADVEVRFGDVVALPEFDLTVAEGEFFTLVGPSGCGKTTALRVLAGLITPSAGSLHVAGRDVTRIRSEDRQFGMVFQNYALFPSMSVEENIAFGLRVQRTPKAKIADAVAAITEQVGLAPDHLRRNVAELSGGQQQRVAIARALVLRPKVLLLDEPLSNLDAQLRQQLRGQLKDLQRHFGITTLFVTHDQDEALTMSDRIAVMNRGRIEQIGTPREIYAQPATEFVCNFIGAANRLAPQLIDRLVASGDLGRADDTTTYLRTEKLSILHGERPEGIVELPGLVTDTAYHGTTSTYVVDCGAAGILRTVQPEDGRSHRIGDRVTVGFHGRDLLQYDARGDIVAQPAARSEAQPAARSEAQPAARSEAQPVARSEVQRAGRGEAQRAGRDDVLSA